MNATKCYTPIRNNWSEIKTIQVCMQSEQVQIIENKIPFEKLKIYITH